MKTIGFIDHFIDEWHANNYPAFIRQSRFAGRFDVTLAWEERTRPGGKSLAAWCGEQGVRRAASIRQVVDECDCLIVLSPDNPERHEPLADLALRSGKPVYIDKPIAPTLAVARRLFGKAAAHGTPMMSCSALRFGSALTKAVRESITGRPVSFAATRGGGVFASYAIHQLEMLVMTLGTGARRVMQCGNAEADVMIADYDDGRRGLISLVHDHPFQLSVRLGGSQTLVVEAMNDFFPRFIEAVLEFLDTGTSPVPVGETLEVAALLEAGSEALKCRDCWVSVPR